MVHVVEFYVEERDGSCVPLSTLYQVKEKKTPNIALSPSTSHKFKCRAVLKKKSRISLHLPRLDPGSVHRVGEANIPHVDELHGSRVSILAQAPDNSQHEQGAGSLDASCARTRSTGSPSVPVVDAAPIGLPYVVARPALDAISGDKVAAGAYSGESSM